MANRRPAGDGMVRQKKRGQWEGRITVGHKSDGKPIFRYVYGKTQKETLEKFDDCYSELTGINERDIFVYAFRLGMRIAIEVLSPDKD